MDIYLFIMFREYLFRCISVLVFISNFITRSFAKQGFLQDEVADCEHLHSTKLKTFLRQ